MSMLRRPAAFLDRDGTIIVDRHYPDDPDQVELLPGAAQAIRSIAEAGYVVVIVTNQSGIARGFYGEPEFRAVQERVEQLLLAEGVSVDAVYHCPHHPGHGPPCDCRKPSLGLYNRAAAEHGLNLASSFYVGDKLGDVLPALATGGRGVLVRTGYGAGVEAEAPERVEVVDDLAAAARLIAAGRGGSPVDTPAVQE